MLDEHPDVQALRRRARELSERPPLAPLQFFRPWLGLDESLSSRKIRDELERIALAGQVASVSSLWWEQRLDSNGDVVSVPGGSPSGKHGDLDLGKRIQGSRWTDLELVHFAISRLFIYPSQAILTADRARNPDGIRELCARCVAPALNSRPGHGRALTLIVRRRRTAPRAFAYGVRALLLPPGPREGFLEVHI
jgi:hypothetical protein